MQPDPTVVSEPNQPGDQPPASFEASLAELETIVQQMEGGSLSLEQSVEAYRRGAELIRHCRDTLTNVRQQVRILEDEVLQPFGSDEDVR